VRWDYVRKFTTNNQNEYDWRITQV